MFSRYRFVCLYGMGRDRDRERERKREMKIVDPPPGVEPEPSAFRAVVQPLHYGGNFHREHME